LRRPAALVADSAQSNSNAKAEQAGRRRAAPAPTAKAWTAKAAAKARTAEPAAAEAWTAKAAAATTVKAAAATAAAAAPASQLRLVDHPRTSLRHRSGVRDPGEAEGRKAQHTGDCARANDLLQDHEDPLSDVKLVAGKVARLLHIRR
jgi:membrane protein involved in colicin uptake